MTYILMTDPEVWTYVGKCDTGELSCGVLCTFTEILHVIIGMELNKLNDFFVESFVFMGPVNINDLNNYVLEYLYNFVDVAIRLLWKSVCYLLIIECGWWHWHDKCNWEAVIKGKDDTR